MLKITLEPGPSPKAARAPQPQQQQPDPAAFAVPAGFGAGMANPGYGFGAPAAYPSGPQDYGLKGPFSDTGFYHNTAQPPPPAGMYPPGTRVPGPAAYPPGERTDGPSGLRHPGSSGFRPPRPPGPRPSPHGPAMGPTRPIGPEMPRDPGPQMPPGEEDEPRPGPSSTSTMSLGDRLKMHRELSSGVGKPIVNEVNEGWRVFNEESSEEEEEEEVRNAMTLLKVLVN